MAKILVDTSAAQRHQHEVWHFGDGHFQAVEATGGPPQRDLKAP